MDNNNYRKFYVDWWHIRKSTIYVLVAIIIFGGAVATFGWLASRNNWFATTDGQDVPKDAAKIISFEGEVRVTRAATRETILLTRFTYVAAGDTIQTQADGRAIVQMIDGSVYTVRPNSTVVIRDTTSLFGGKNVRVRLNDGTLNVRTDEQPEDTRNVVELAETENQVGPKTDASFNTDGTNGGEIRVSRGGLETTLGGDKTTIGANEYATVDGNKLSGREKLLAPPIPIAPENSSQITDASGSGASVGYSWQDSDGSGAASYYLQVSKSPWFSSDSMLVDRPSLQTRDFRQTGLSPGTYYWRLKATARSGQTTVWNDAWKFTVLRHDSQRIDVSDWHVDGVGGGVYFISGRTGAGMAVRAQGRETFAGPDGTFKLQISAPGAEVAVEVSDDIGNRGGFIVSLQNGSLLRRY